MRRLSKTGSSRLTADSQRLVSLALEMFYASSFLESEFCRKKLDALVFRLLQAKKQSVLNDAIEYLFTTDMEAYNCLLEVAEALSESAVIERNGKRYHALLVAIPVLAWTRFSIASGTLAPELVESVADRFARLILADGVRFALAPGLYAVDQLPYSHVDVIAVTQGLIQSIVQGSRFELASRQETVPFLADGRYLLASVMAVEGEPLFRWQAIPDPAGFETVKEECLKLWQQEMTPIMAEVLPGCNVELLLPGGFFNTCRKADQAIRPSTIRAAVHYLVHALDTQPENLCAVVGGFGKDLDGVQVEEYRIGFYRKDNEKIVYGIVWPVYGTEEVNGMNLPSRLEGHSSASSRKGGKQLLDIFQLLRELGVSYEKTAVERFAMEFCEDCGAPLFADTNGELVHAEMPEDAKKETRLH
ncbi:DUF2863 family protein [Oxalobacter paraformigenes]|uniref:DUF2863 family protein n=1 Tax=Oxalobacter paraformigenes TaxID=556268 RepID=C3X4F0_9BURK|nr:DUF2863 family protein [Oxalobacter paraformigenes]EEO28086.1 hypothetical protein OFAG_01239 [Oxalobacter paraformigenes]